MSQLPQNNEAFGNAPEYAKLNQTNGNWQPYAGVLGNQLLPGKRFHLASQNGEMERMRQVFHYFSAPSAYCVSRYRPGSGHQISLLSH